MLSIQDIVDKTKTQRDNIEKYMDSRATYHPHCLLPGDIPIDITTGLSDSDAVAVNQAIHQIPLSEFLAKSGTAGISGAAYLVPVKVHDLALAVSGISDKVPLISRQIIEDWKGDEWSLSVADPDKYKPRPFSSGGVQAAMEGAFSQVTMTFDVDHTLGIAVSAGNDLVEDVQDYNVIEWHITQAAQAFGREATDRALTVLKTATDGVGTVNAAATADADETKYTGGATSDILTAWAAVAEDHFIANTLVTTPEAWEHSISQTTTAGTMDAVAPIQIPDGEWDLKLATLNLDVLWDTSPCLHDSDDLPHAAFTECISIVFDRYNALVTGRKRWLRVTEYAQPRDDLMGAVIVGGQDSVTIYNASVYRLTET